MGWKGLLCLSLLSLGRLSVLQCQDTGIDQARNWEQQLSSNTNTQDRFAGIPQIQSLDNSISDHNTFSSFPFTFVTQI